MAFSIRVTQFAKARTILLGVAFWTAVSLVFALPTLRGNPHWLQALAAGLDEWWAWGLLTPLIFLLDRWLLRLLPSWPVRACAHLALGVLVSVGYTYVAALLGALLRLAPWSSLWGASSFAAAFHGLFWSLLVYLLIAGVAEAYQFQRSYAAATLQMERLEKSFSQARLNALRMQLDPHFLFNALNTISSQITVDPRLARRMVEHLGDLLRASLESGGQQEISLRAELAFLEHYLAIQRLRFGDRLHVHVSVPSHVEEAIVPSLVLQPLVENAIRHGVGPRSRGGSVAIAVRVHGGRLQLRVADDGVGLPENWSASQEGLGLSVTRERLAALHPANSTLEIGRLPGGGTEVCIDIPYRHPGAAIASIS